MYIDWQIKVVQVINIYVYILELFYHSFRAQIFQTLIKSLFEDRGVSY